MTKYGIKLHIYRKQTVDHILLVDNINVLERATRDEHILAPDSYTIHGAPGAFKPIHATHIRCRIIGHDADHPLGQQTIVQWRSPFSGKRGEWMDVPLASVDRITAYWF